MRVSRRRAFRAPDCAREPSVGHTSPVCRIGVVPAPGRRGGKRPADAASLQAHSTTDFLRSSPNQELFPKFRKPNHPTGLVSRSSPRTPIRGPAPVPSGASAVRPDLHRLRRHRESEMDPAFAGVTKGARRSAKPGRRVHRIQTETRCVHAVASEPGPISRRCGRRDSPETGPGSGSGATVRARNRCHESQIETAGISADSVPIGLHFGPSPKLSPWPLSRSNFRVDLAARYINFAVFYKNAYNYLVELETANGISVIKPHSDFFNLATADGGMSQ